MSGTTSGAVYAGGTNTLQQVIPSYLYQEYADDSDLQAFVAAQNSLSNEFLAWFNTLNLPIYTSGFIAGALLDWVGQGIYGVSRPVFQNSSSIVDAAIDTYAINTNGINLRKVTTSSSFSFASDDIYKRVITWNYYKSDGFQFNIVWLKRRVARFLAGLNGTDPGIDTTYNVSVSFSGGAFTITIPAGSVATILASAIADGIVNLPFQYTYSVVT